MIELHSTTSSKNTLQNHKEELSTFCQLVDYQPLISLIASFDPKGGVALSQTCRTVRRAMTYDQGVDSVHALALSRFGEAMSRQVFPVRQYSSSASYVKLERRVCEGLRSFLDLNAFQYTRVNGGQCNFRSLNSLEQFGIIQLRPGLDIREIPQSFAFFKNLQILDVSGAHCTSICQTVRQLPNLQTLRYETNLLQDLAVNPEDFPRLERLNLYRNFIEGLTFAQGGLSSLTSLDLSYNRLAELPRSFPFTTTLTVLLLSNNFFRSIPDVVLTCVNVETLCLGNNEIDEITPGISQMKALRFLQLWQNAITELPQEMGALTKLVHLNLEHNSLEGVPDSFTSLRSIQVLNLRFNRVPPMNATIFPGLRRGRRRHNPIPQEYSTLEIMFVRGCDVLIAAQDGR